MRWQIAHYIFCDQQQTLTLGNEVQQLEPMMVELLSYFCRNGNKIISKDALIEHVWLGRIVSDNAVSKLITKLRKAFNDDVRQPLFIATFPKKGYKFIAEVAPLSDEVIKVDAINEQTDNAIINAEHEKSNTHTLEQAKPLNGSYYSFIPHLLLFIVLLLSGLYGISSLLKPANQTPIPATFAKAITTGADDELFPAFSPDGSRVAYMSWQKDRIHLKIKNVADGQIIDVTHGENIGVGPADWSSDGTMIAYLVATPELCQYYIRKIDGLTLGEAKLIHNCPAGSYGKIAFTHDNNRLVFSESEKLNAPYSLFEINIVTQKKKRLNQPELFLGGNSQFDLHPTENKLLISSPDKQQWEGFYFLDLDTDQLTLLFKQDAYICCGIWNHDGDRVVLMGEHPAHKLLSYDLTGKDAQLVFSASRQIRSPKRHSNGEDYLFFSGETNLNIHSLNLKTKEQAIIANDSIDERLAVLAQNTDQVAYIGLASGNEEVWLANTHTKQRRILTQFNDSHHYVDLKWSPSGAFIAALTLNEIHLINVKTGQFERLKIPQTEIKGLSFKSEQVIAYSTFENEQWRVYNYQLDKHKVVAEDAQWQFIQYANNAEDTLWLNQQGQLFVSVKQRLVSSTVLSAHHLTHGRQFNLTKRGNDWYWFEQQEQNRIQRYNDQTLVLETLVQTDAVHFDVQADTMLFGQVKQGNINIFQTQTVKHR